MGFGRYIYILFFFESFLKEIFYVEVVEFSFVSFSGLIVYFVCLVEEFSDLVCF